MKNYILLLSLISFSLSFGQTKTPPNIIFLIGDGMGLTQITTGMYANNNNTELEKFEYVGLSKTQAARYLVTDSAASGTAMACGEKTYNGVIGMNSKNEKIPSILDHCANLGYKTALLATSSIVHATPASFYAHVDTRKKYEEIAFQLMSSNVDYFIGGGKKHFTRRDDGKNLLKNPDSPYKIAESLDEYISSTADKIGLLTYYEEPPKKSMGREPALPDMLSGGHANDVPYVVSEFLEFNQTIGVALEFAKKHGNTLVVVTADHETGGLALTKGNIKRNQVSGGFNTKGHSATMVPVFSYGPAAEQFAGIYENTAIFTKLKTAVSKE